MPVIKFGNYLDRKIPEKTIKILFFSELLQPFPTTVSVWVYCGGSDLTIKENKLAGQNWGCLGIGWLPRLSMYPYFKKKNVRSPVFMVTFTGSRSSRNHYSTTLVHLALQHLGWSWETFQKLWPLKFSQISLKFGRIGRNPAGESWFTPRRFLAACSLKKSSNGGFAGIQ